jgi:hypothetical protein
VFDNSRGNIESNAAQASHNTYEPGQSKKSNLPSNTIAALPKDLWQPVQNILLCRGMRKDRLPRPPCFMRSSITLSPILTNIFR